MDSEVRRKIREDGCFSSPPGLGREWRIGRRSSEMRLPSFLPSFRPAGVRRKFSAGKKNLSGRRQQRRLSRSKLRFQLQYSADQRADCARINRWCRDFKCHIRYEFIASHCSHFALDAAILVATVIIALRSDDSDWSKDGDLVSIASCQLGAGFSSQR